MKKAIYVSFAGVFGSAFLWLVSFKVVAYWLGPTGIGLFSQLRQIVQAATVGATLGGTNAVVQGLSSREDEQERRRFRATASRLIGTIGIGVVLSMLLFAQQLTRLFLSSSSPELVASVRWISLAVLLNVAGTYVIAVLNGYRSYKFLALAQIAGPLAMVAALLAMYFGHMDYQPEILALLFILCFGTVYLVGAWGVSRLGAFRASVDSCRLEFQQLRGFVKFAASNMFAALFTTLTLLLIRSWIIEVHDLAFAGLFDAAWTLTFNYTTLFLTACGTIYLPLLTGATRAEEQKAYILKTAYLVLSGVSLVGYLMVAFKSSLIHLLYSTEFGDASDALTILAVAVILRGVSWVYGMLIVATRDSRMLLMSDFILNLGLLALSRYCLQHYQSLESLAWAFVVSNLLYLVFVIEYACHKNSLLRRRQIWPLAGAAALPLVVFGGAQWLLLMFGPVISAIAWIAYKKVNA